MHIGKLILEYRFKQDQDQGPREMADISLMAAFGLQVFRRGLEDLEESMLLVGELYWDKWFDLLLRLRLQGVGLPRVVAEVQGIGDEDTPLNSIERTAGSYWTDVMVARLKTFNELSAREVEAWSYAYDWCRKHEKSKEEFFKWMKACLNKGPEQAPRDG